jgi:very-short-patch-repair endonuclease
MNYKHGKSSKNKKYYCIDCNKLLSDYRHKRCYSCSSKNNYKNKLIDNKGKNNGNYKHGKYMIKYYCVDCGKKISIGHMRCHKCASISLWKDEDFRGYNLKSSFKNRLIKPNKPEKVLIKLLSLILPKEYKYVGDGQVILKGFNPDFINVNGQKKIIELFGDYWHSKTQSRDRKRLGAYKSLGYKTLIIWDYELKDLEKLKEKILYFNNNKE